MGTATNGQRNLADDDLTRAVVESFAASSSPRFREVVESLVRHLHAFAADVRLTEEEWATGIDFLTRTGQKCDDRRQEFILLSDVLGLSMLTIGINHGSEGATEATVFGPFFVEGSPRIPNGGDIANGAPGDPCHMEGRVTGTDGRPVSGARVEIWEADDDGFYDVQYAGLDEPRGRGHLHTDADGRYAFWSVRPAAYPIPDDGPVGELLAAGGRGPMRPAHVHFQIVAPGYETLTTHVFADGDEHLDGDAVFGVKSSLITDFTRHVGGTAPDGRPMEGDWASARFDFVLAPAGRSPAAR